MGLEKLPIEQRESGISMYDIAICEHDTIKCEHED